MWPLHVSICPQFHTICPFSRVAMEEKFPQLQLPNIYLEKKMGIIFSFKLDKSFILVHSIMFLF